MYEFITLLMPVEMLFINLFVVDRCSPKKYSNTTTYSALSAVGVIIVIATYSIISNYDNFGNGNGFFVFAGFIFLIPIRLLYDTTASKIISLACTAWIYTFIMFSISIHISNIYPGMNRTYTAFAIQTVLIIITLFWYIKILRTRYMPMLKQLSEKETISLMWMSICWFWTVFILNLCLIYTDIYAFRILTLLSITLCALTTYYYIYLVVKNDRIIQELEHIAYHDELTQLRGRALLTNDIQHLINRKIEFFVVFMDLDNFKTINDTFGHNVGDEYLAFFAQQVKYRLGSRGGFYRIAGDEFVCLFTDSNITLLIDSLATIPKTLPDSDVPFIGVSYGIARCPEDGKNIEKLLEIADSRMYEMKEKVHSN